MDGTAEATDEISVYQIHSGDGDGADMVFAFNGRRISVSIFPSNGSSARDSRYLGPEERPLQDRLIELLSRATLCQDDDEYETLADQVLDVILDAGRHLFSQPMPPQQGTTSNQSSLHHLLFPETLYFRLEVAAGRTYLVPVGSSEAYTILTIDPVLDGAFEEELDIDARLPRYTPETIIVTDLLLRGADSVTAAVQLDGRDMFCKASSRSGGLSGTNEGRELECLSKMLREHPQKGIPQLLGYIYHEETNRVLGLLRQWVPGRMLSEINITTTTAETRRKWISQIRQNIQNLHKRGLVWGNGKTSNIIIDERDDAWLIGFGGGFSDGWVDEELAETREGDEQALTNIAKSLDVDGDAAIS